MSGKVIHMIIACMTGPYEILAQCIGRAFLVMRLPQKHHVKLQRLMKYLTGGPVTWSRNGPHRTIAWVQSSFAARLS